MIRAKTTTCAMFLVETFDYPAPGELYQLPHIKGTAVELGDATAMLFFWNKSLAGRERVFISYGKAFDNSKVVQYTFVRLWPLAAIICRPLK